MQPWFWWSIAIILNTLALPFEKASLMDYIVHFVYLAVHGGMTLLTFWQSRSQPQPQPQPLQVKI
jgi:hypothetical protein